MAWRSSGATNEVLVANLAQNGMINSDRVKEAMLKVDRAHFAPRSPYQDSPQSIGHAATISAPHMHANACCSLLDYLEPGSRVLDIGSGSGYLTAVLAHLVSPGGTVIGVDHIQPLVDLSTANFKKSPEGTNMLDNGTVKFIKADGRKGWAEGAPYDAIHVGAAAKEHHEELTTQLKAPGRLFVPVEEDGDQYIFVVDKAADGKVEKKRLYGVRYVPLCDAPKG
ncbi:protein-L-isoaspartate O-methyltransferase [Pleomassaria siparia CBS 279.74]|uniref:Protein-L-isoaspartate O-methyltransferase n=1 Tax=Pleomassaria siparia CBS 279.74 TaxID=1314801 RepID=A0A6G1K4Z5_9PLEO|nr:protein-L-isoaspartate O-methyltransferase [Pleomassaria siparia CBS 279.74]